MPYETDLDIATDFTSGCRAVDIVNYLRTEWSDAALTCSIFGPSAGMPDATGVCDSGTLRIYSTGDPSAQDVIDLQTWGDTYDPGTGMDSTYTNLMLASLCEDGTLCVGNPGASQKLVVANGSSWDPFALVADPAIPTTFSANDDYFSNGGSSYVATDLTVTPGAGTWLVLVQGTIDCSFSGKTAHVAIFYDGVEVKDFEVISNPRAAVSVLLPSLVTTAGKVVDVRVHPGGYTTYLYEASLVLIQIG